MNVVLTLLLVAILYTGIRTFSHSMKRKKTEGEEREKHQAQMNIHMGLMFIAIAFMHGLAFSGSWLRLLLLIFIAGLGFYNLTFGWRYHNYLKKKMEQI